MTFTIPRALFVSGVTGILVASFPAVFWSGDSTTISLSAFVNTLALLLGYLATSLLWSALRVAGGRMRHSLQWMMVGVGSITLAFLVGSLLPYYEIVGSVVAAVFKAVLLLCGVASLMVAGYWFYSIAAPALIRWQGLWPAAGVAGGATVIIFMVTNYGRILGESFERVLTAASLVLALGILVTAGQVFFYTGIGYFRFLTTYCLALVALVSALTLAFFMPTDALFVTLPGSLWEHVLHVLAMTFFFTSALQLHQLEVYLVGNQAGHTTRV